MTDRVMNKRLTVKFIDSEYDDYYVVKKVINIKGINPGKVLTIKQLEQYLDDEDIEVVIK